SGVCRLGLCLTASCGDGTRDFTETDRDCGGACGGCPEGGLCLGHGDCLGGVCTHGACLDRCGDGIANGDETDVDCGGSCLPCHDLRGCAANSDCESRMCLHHVCISCQDGVRDGSETDLDCGGLGCSACG